MAAFKRLRKQMKSWVGGTRNQKSQDCLASGVFNDLSKNWRVDWVFSTQQAEFTYTHSSGPCLKHSVSYDSILELSLESILAPMIYDDESAPMTSDQERQLLLVVVYLMDNHVVTSLFNWSDDLSVSDAENIMAIWRSERRNSAATRSSRDLPVNGNRSSVNVMWRGKALVPSGRLLVWIATETEIVYCYSDSVLCCLPLYHIGDLVYRAADGSLQITFVTYKSYQNGPHDLLSDVIIKDRGSGNASEVIQNEIMLLRFGTESEFQEFSMLWRQQMQLKSIEDALRDGGADGGDLNRLYREAVAVRKTLTARVLPAAGRDLNDLSSLVAEYLQNITLQSEITSADARAQGPDPSCNDEDTVKQATDTAETKPAERCQVSTLKRADSMRRFLARGPSVGANSWRHSRLPSAATNYRNQIDSQSGTATPPSLHSSQSQNSLVMPAVMEEAGSTTPLPPESFREQSENTTGDNRLLLTQCPAISDNNKNDDDDDDDKSDSDAFATTPELHILCTTLHPYTAQGPGEMSLEAKDLVRILRKDESGWWYGLLLKPAVLVRRGTDCSTTDENCTECSEQQQQQEINVDAESEEQQQQQQEQLKQKHEQRKSGRWVVVAEGWCPSNFLKVLMTSEQAQY